MTTKMVITIKPKLNNKRKKKNKGLVWVHGCSSYLRKSKTIQKGKQQQGRLNAKGNKTPITYDYPSNG